MPAEGSGDLLPPSPPAEKATARQDQAGQTGIDDRAATGAALEGANWIAVERAGCTGRPQHQT
jgi:hypothetical protein